MVLSTTSDCVRSRRSSGNFVHKSPFLSIVILWTLLGAILGPSSATTMAPSLDEFEAARVILPLNITSTQIWPVQLGSSLMSTANCSESSSVCYHTGTWTSLAANTFSYWGENMLGGLKGTTEMANVPGKQSNRQMRYRFRGFSLFQPEYTSATTQPVWTADCANYLRYLWTNDHNQRCSRGENHYCSYQDLRFSIQTLQPNVAVACNAIQLGQAMMFPTMIRNNGRSVAESTVKLFPEDESMQQTKLTWLKLDGQSHSQTSAGVVVRLPPRSNYSSSISLACSIDAQWSKSTIATTFLNSPLVVDGFDPYFYQPTREGSTYVGSKVNISPEWAESINHLASKASNQTAFDMLLNTGKNPKDSDTAIPKVEAILSVLVAESMAWIGSDASVDFGSSPETVNWSSITSLKATSTGASVTNRTNEV